MSEIVKLVPKTKSREEFSEEMHSVVVQSLERALSYARERKCTSLGLVLSGDHLKFIYSDFETENAVSLCGNLSILENRVAASVNAQDAIEYEPGVETDDEIE